MILSSMKLTKGEVKGRGISLLGFICWKAGRYMRSIKLPLSTSTWWILKSSNLSIITSELSWGCLTMRASFSKKMIFGLLHLGVFEGRNCEWTLYTSLAYAFFHDLEDPLTTNPLEIIFISPMGAFLPPSLIPYLSRPSTIVCVALSFVQSSIVSLDGSRSLPSPSNVCIRQCDVCGLGEIYCTCSCLLLLLKHKLV